MAGESLVLGVIVCRAPYNDFYNIHVGEQVNSCFILGALQKISCADHILVCRTLFELEIARAAGHAEEWTVVLESAVIEAVDPTAAKETPNLLGKLINSELGVALTFSI